MRVLMICYVTTALVSFALFFYSTFLGIGAPRPWPLFDDDGVPKFFVNENGNASTKRGGARPEECSSLKIRVLQAEYNINSTTIINNATVLGVLSALISNLFGFFYLCKCKDNRGRHDT